ncbi:Mitochondrial distribution and morphology protein 10 [Lobosporangium transversale]|nr:Mitochondrial distribution and morphology protein 10 [Lobosporangium transversale]
MYDFMEYCLRRYYRASGWNEDNQYSHLCATTRALLDFQAPQGLSLRLSKLPSTVFKTTTTMNALPILEGSLGYLFTSRALPIDDSASVRFRHLVDRFRIICLDHSIREADQWTELDQDGKKRKAQYQYDKGKYCAEMSFTTDDGLIGIRGLYNFGKDFDDSYESMLQESRLRRHRQLQQEECIEKVLLENQDSSSVKPEQQSEDSTLATSSTSRSSSPLSKSTVIPTSDLSRDPNSDISSKVDSSRAGYLDEEMPEEWIVPSERIRGYWSVGAELYYSATEKLGGFSTGLRYRTLPPLAPADISSENPTTLHYPTSTAPEQHQNYVPITITQTLNPIMGHVSSSYAAQVHPDLGLCSRFDFNLYSYDSELTAGFEWWIRESKKSSTAVVVAAAQEKDDIPFPKTVGMPDLPATVATTETKEKQPVIGVIKARLGVQSGLAIMWEGRFNKLLFSLGFVGHVFSPHTQDPIVKTVGLEIQYFS